MIPESLLKAKGLLEGNVAKMSKLFIDGRLNSVIDEINVVSFLDKHLQVKIPSKRMWYDVLIYDTEYGWIPCNIKTTTTETNDNVGNLSVCVHALTSHELDFDKSYKNGYLSDVLIDCIRSGQLNTDTRKDYFFLVINKVTREVIVNSVLGLTSVVSNVNNLPFQIKWKNNKKYNHVSISHTTNMILDAMSRETTNWREKFLHDIKHIR